MSENEIDTGDAVLHRPSGEQWVVAFAKDGAVCPCGGPLTYANIDDCTLVEKATPERRRSLLHLMADASLNDPRRHHADYILKKEEAAK